MNDFIPHNVSPTSAFKVWCNKLTDWMRRNELKSSSDILVSQTTYGTTLAVSDKIKKKWNLGGAGSPGIWANYDCSASYGKGTIVWVDPNVTSSIPFNVPSGSTYPPLCPGAFECLTDIPSLAVSGSTRFGPDTYRYPFYPQWPTSSVYTVSGSTFNQLVFGPISPMTSMSVCINDNPQVWWIAGVQQGATFQYTLPYTGSH